MPMLGIMASSMNKGIPLTNLKLWYDGSDSTTITQSGGRVSAITNKAPGISFTLSQGTSGRQPLVVAAAQNGLQALRLTNARVDQLLNSTASPLNGATSITWFFARKTNSTTDGYAVSVGSDSGGATWSLLAQLSNKATHAGSSGTNTLTGTNNTNGTALVQMAEILGSAGNTQKVVTGSTDTVTGSGTNLNIGGGYPTFPYSTSIGSAINNSGNIPIPDFDFYEVLVYSGSLSAANQTTVISYLKTKWGI